MAALGSRERSSGQGGSGGGGGSARQDSDLLLHPELLSQEFLLLTLEQKNIPVEEVKTNKDGLTDLYVQHVIPLPQRELPKTRWGKLMEKKRGQQVFKQEAKSTAPVESLRKRPLIVFDGSSTSTSIKVRKAENGAVDSLKLLTARSPSTTCKGLTAPSNSSACVSVSTFSPDIKVGPRINEAKRNNNLVDNNMAPGQRPPPLVPLTGTTVVKLKRAAPKDESDASNGLKSPESKKKIQHVKWP